jgi:hypothetical protein
MIMAMNGEEETQRMRQAFETEFRKRIRNGQRRFAKRQKVEARLWGVDLDRLIEDEEEEAQPRSSMLG